LSLNRLGEERRQTFFKDSFFHFISIVDDSSLVKGASGSPDQSSFPNSNS
jgi:hypothetical protein